MLLNTTPAMQWSGYLPSSCVREFATAEGAKAVLTGVTKNSYNKQYHEKKGC
jgi:hypothetical protein